MRLALETRATGHRTGSFDFNDAAHEEWREEKQGAPTMPDNQDEVAHKTVWVSEAMRDSTLIKGFQSEPPLREQKSALEAIGRATHGDPLPPDPDHYPKELFYKYPSEHLPRQPDIFNAGGIWTVSAAFADVLRQFNLGSTALYPVRLLQHDRKTPIDGDYFCLAFGESKDTFLPEDSPKAKTMYFNKDRWKLSLDPHDDDLALNASATNGVDLWLEPKVFQAIFLSDPLVQALKSAKLAQGLGLLRCRVI
jgi:hypothetical protein